MPPVAVPAQLLDEDTARDTPVDAQAAFTWSSLEASAPREPLPERVSEVRNAKALRAVPDAATDEGFDPRRTLSHQDDAPMLYPGERIGEVTIVDLFRRGGISEIYTAKNEVLGITCIVKVLSRRFAVREDVRERLEVEARALAQLRGCVGVVQILTAGRDPRVGPYIVMEKLEGRTLRELMGATGALPIWRALSIGIMLAMALDTLHKIEIVHRDLKPENVFVVDVPDAPGSFRVAILDLGCARTPYSRSTTKEKVTMGTARYMSPEHAQKKKITPASDQYVLGYILLEMLTGEHAFEEGCRNNPDANGFTEMFWHTAVDPEAPPEVLCPRALWLVIQRMVRKAPEERFALTSEVAVRLRAVLRDVTSGEINREAPTTPAEAPGFLPQRASDDLPAVARTAPNRPARSIVPVIKLDMRAATPTLLAHGLPGGKRRFALADAVTLGRERGRVDIWLDDPSVSRLHAELRRSRSAVKAHTYEVMDSGSTNGIEIAGTPARFGILEPYDVLGVGDLKLVVLPPGAFDDKGRFIDEETRQGAVRSPPSMSRGVAKAQPRRSPLLPALSIGGAFLFFATRCSPWQTSLDGALSVGPHRRPQRRCPLPGRRTHWPNLLPPSRRHRRRGT